MTIAPQFSFESIDFAAKILGMSFEVFFLVFLCVGAVGGWFVRDQLQRWEFRRLLKETRNKILVEYFDKSGQIIPILCEKSKEGMIKKTSKDTAGTFNIPEKIKSNIGDLQTVNYPIYPDHVWKKWYPDKKPRHYQVNIEVTHFYMNGVRPIISKSPNDWTDAKYLERSASIFTQASDDKVLESLLSKVTGYLQTLAKIVGDVSQIRMVKMVIIGIAFLLAVNVVMSFMSIQKQDYQTKMLQSSGIGTTIVPPSK